MDPKKLSIRLSAKGKKEEKAGKEDRRLAPMMRALKAIHSVGAPDSMNPEDLAKQRAGQELWGPRAGGDNQILRVNMANIRRKIEKNPAEPEYLFTEVGVGYRMAENTDN